MTTYTFQQKLDILDSDAPPDNLPSSTISDWRKLEPTYREVVRLGFGSRSNISTQVKRALELSRNDSISNKKQNNGGDSEQVNQLHIKIQQLTHDIGKLTTENKQLTKVNNDVVLDNTQLLLQIAQKNKFTQNRQLVHFIATSFNYPVIKNSYDKKRMIDLNSGEFKWWSEELVGLFDEVYAFDALKNTANGYKNKFATKHNLRIGSYTDLDVIRRSVKLFDLTLSDLPYIQKQGDYNGLNNSESSESIKNKDYRYGIDGFTLPEQYLRYMMLNHLSIAEDMLKVGGVLLLKLQRKGIHLSETVIEASIGSGLMYVGEIAFGDTSPGDSTNKRQSQMLMFVRVKKPAIVPSKVYPGHPHLTLPKRVSILQRESRKELIPIGIGYSNKLTSRMLCFVGIFNELLRVDSDNKARLLDRLGNLGSRYYNRAGLKDNTANEITWRIQSVNWNQDNNLWTLLEFQQKIINETKRWTDVTNMCVIAFAMVLKSRNVSAKLTVASEKKNKYQVRRDALFACDIMGKMQDRFINDSVARLYKNADNLSDNHRTVD